MFLLYDEEIDSVVECIPEDIICSWSRQIDNLNYFLKYGSLFSKKDFNPSLKSFPLINLF